MQNPPSGTGEPDETDQSALESGPVEALVFECLERMAQEGDRAVDDLCAQHPEHAAALRIGIAKLQRAGLVESARAFPERLGEFRLIRRLGGGGMGVVYLAEQTPLGRKVALKILRPEHLYFAGTRERFRREAEAIARLRHPGIVPVHVVGDEDGIPYFAMELVEGCTLAEAISDLQAREPASLEGRDLAEAVAQRSGTSAPAAPARIFDGSWAATCIRIALEVARALDHAHQNGVIHRDVKPTNVMVTAEGRVMLVDFGLARTRGATRLTLTGSTIGSIPYMPPERVRGEDRELDATTDVYSLGVTVYELLCLRPAFLAPDTEKTRQLILQGRPKPIRAANPSVTWDAETVCAKAMDPDPARRYPTIAALARDLQNVLELKPIDAKRPGPVLRARRFAQRHPALSVGVTMGFLIVVGFPLAFGLHQRAAREESDRLRYADNMVAAAASLRNHETTEVRRLLDRCREDLRGWEWAHLRAESDTSLAVVARHAQSVEALAVHGDCIASGSNDGLVQVRSAATGALRLELTVEPSAPVTALCFGPKGTRLFAGLFDGRILEYDATSGALAPVARAHEGGSDGAARVCSLAVGEDGTKILSCTLGQVVVWDGASATALKVIDPGSRVLSAALSPDETMIAIASRAFPIGLWSAVTGELLGELAGHEGNVRTVAFGPHGEHLVSGSGDRTVRVWEVASRKLVSTLRGHDDGVFCVAVSHDGKKVASAAADKTVRIWNPRTTTALSVQHGHEGEVTALAFSADGESLWSASRDRTVRAWDGGAVEVLAFERGVGGIGRFATSPGSWRLACSSFGKRLQVFDMGTGARLHALEGLDNSLVALALHPDGKTLFTVQGATAEVGTWDAATDAQIGSMKAHAATVDGLAVRPDGALVASGSRDGKVLLWKPGSGEVTETLDAGPGEVRALTFAPDGGLLAAGFEDGKLRVWNLRQSRRLGTVDAHEERINTLCFSPDGTSIASGGVDKTVAVWDARDLGLIARLRGHDDSVRSVVFSPDAQRLASGSIDRTIRLWETERFEPVCTLRGHTSWVMGLAWTPDGTRLLSGSNDSSIRIWDRRPAAERRLARGQPGAAGAAQAK